MSRPYLVGPPGEVALSLPSASNPYYQIFFGCPFTNPIVDLALGVRPSDPKGDGFTLPRQALFGSQTFAADPARMKFVDGARKARFLERMQGVMQRRCEGCIGSGG